MVGNGEPVAAFQEPDYGYGNHSPIEVIKLTAHRTYTEIDPHASLDHDTQTQPLFTEAELKTKVGEIADNYRVISDPKSTEASPKQFGMTVANADLLAQGKPAILMISTNGSSLYNEKGIPNNEGNALELAYMAFDHPDKPVVFVESPGNGNSSDLDDEEYKEAARDGRLVRHTTNVSGRVVGYVPFETMQALARALANEGISISHVSSNATGAHFSTALISALPKNSVERAFLYNPSNVSDRSIAALTFDGLREVITQSKYANLSKDPLRLTDERREMARMVMGSVAKRRLDEVTASTHNPVKLWRQQKIFRRGMNHGQSAAVQSVASQLQQNDMRQTFVFPEFASQYKNIKDFEKFMQYVGELGSWTVELSDLESLRIPLGQYGHSHYPSVRQTLEGYAFNR